MTDDLTTRLLAAIEDELESAEHVPWCASVYREWENPKPTACNCDRLEVAERMAVAHRKIVDLHAPVRIAPTWTTFGLTPLMETTGGVDCKTCCDDDAGTSYAQRSGLESPCATIRALAEGYGLTIEPAP